MAFFITCICFVAGDIITGLCKGFYKKEINSTVLRQGLFHKLSEILAVCGAYLLEVAVQYIDLGVTLPLLKPVACYIILMELVSIIENLCEMNPQLMRLFKPYLQKFKGDDNDVRN